MMDYNNLGSHAGKKNHFFKVATSLDSSKSFNHQLVNVSECVGNWKTEIGHEGTCKLCNVRILKII
jgi:hypothetical protein